MSELVIGSLDLLAALGALAGLAALCKWAAGGYRAAQLFLGSALSLYVFIGLANALEHLQVTTVLDPFEDLAEILFFPFLLFFFFAARTAREMQRRIQAEVNLQSINQNLENRVAQRSAEAEQRAQQLRVLTSELHQAEHRERRRLARILHDQLQQVLVAALMWVGLAQKDVAHEDHANGELERVRNLLDQSVGITRTLTAELSPPIYDAGLVPALHWLARQMKEKHHLSVEVAADASLKLPCKDLDVLLFDAARELLFNIVKHAKVEMATVTLTCPRGQVQLVVEDHGRGFIPPDNHARPGTFGLLDLCERAAFLGGKLQIQSAPGQGTRATVNLPLSATPAESQPPAASAVPARPPAAASARPLRVLLADDHQVFRQGLRSFLDHEPNLSVVGEACDGRQTIIQTCALHPDVVVMDCAMPLVTGVEATRRIRRQCPQTCVIGLSMYQDPEIANAMRRAGAAAYLTKDGTVQALIAAIFSCTAQTDTAADQPLPA